MAKLIVFTDLDGTLLDHHTYQYDAALPAIAQLKASNIPLILISSKTRAEIQSLQQALDINYPLVCENGAAIYRTDSQGENWYQEFSQPRTEIINYLNELKSRHDFKFEGFSDWSVEEIAEKTGLTVEQASLASERDFTEPLLWYGDEDDFIQFQALLAERKLRAVQGGRFVSIMGEFDKSTALEWLKQHYSQQTQEKPVIIALGDSPNDEQMLNTADIAVLIKSEQSDQLEVGHATKLIRTEMPGPEGWNQAIQQILKEYN